MLATASCSSSGRYGICSMISRKVRLDVAGQRLELGDALDHVGQLVDPGDEVGLLGDVVAEADPLRPLDQDADRAVGDLEHARDRRRPRRRRRGRRGPARRARGRCEATIASIRLPQRTSSTSLIERSCPTASGVSVSGKVTVSRSGSTGSASGRGSLERIASSTSSGDSTTSSTGVPSITPARIGTRRVASARIEQGQLDPQDAVLIGGAGAVGVDVDLELDDAAKWARRNLHLLVDAALGLLHRSLADYRQVPAADLEVDISQVDARRGRP